MPLIPCRTDWVPMLRHDAFTDRSDLMQRFTRICETKSFSQAAREIRATQSAASKRLSALEAHVGVKLLERNTRGVRTTESRALYYEECKRWLGEMRIWGSASYRLERDCAAPSS